LRDVESDIEKGKRNQSRDPKISNLNGSTVARAIRGRGNWVGDTSIVNCSAILLRRGNEQEDREDVQSRTGSSRAGIDVTLWVNRSLELTCKSEGEKSCSQTEIEQKRPRADERIWKECRKTVPSSG